MEMMAFNSKFPEIAEKETRSITIVDNSNGLENGQYFFIEKFCTDRTCDCRRAMVQVFGPNGKFFATLSYGWESLDFYTQWMYGNSSISHTIIGAQLYSQSPQTKDSNQFLDFFKTMLEDTVYANRIKRHYELFKKAKKPKPNYFTSPKLNKKIEENSRFY